MNMCVSYNAGEFGDFIRYFCGLHTGQIEDTDIIFDNDFMGMHKIILEPNKHIHITEKLNTDSFLKLFQKSCPPPSTHIYKVKLSTNEDDKHTHNILNTPEYDIIHSLKHKIIFTELELLSEWGLLFFKRIEMLCKHWNIPYDKKWYVKKFTKLKEYPKHELNHILQIDRLLDCDQEEYDKLINFLQCKPKDNWKEIVKKYTTWIKKDLDNTA